MADYRPLNPVQVNSAPDQTGRNGGNLTTHFASQQMPNVNVFEIYHATVTGGPPLATATILIASRTWSVVQLGITGQNEWDPQQPALMAKDQEIYFQWAIPVASTQPPVVTLWPRYDASLPENAGAGR